MNSLSGLFYKIVRSLSIVIILLPGCYFVMEQSNPYDPANPNNTIPPADVTNLSAAASDSTVTLSWTNPGDADFDHVLVTWDPDGALGISAARGATTIEISGLTNNTSYIFTVKSVDTDGYTSEGKSISQVPADTTGPGNVQDLTVSPSSGQITLNWTDPVDVDMDLDQIEITWTPADGPAQPLLTAKGTQTHTLTGLTDYTQLYTITVKTIDIYNNKSAGVVIQSYAGEVVPPDEVTGVVKSEADHSVTLTWTDPTTSDFDHVLVSWTPTGGSPSQPVSVAKGVQTQTITGLTNGSTYTFTLKTVDNKPPQNTSPGIQITAVPNAAPGPVTNLHGVTIPVSPLLGNVSIAWTDPTDPDLDHIVVTWTPAEGTTSQPANVNKGTQTLTITGLTIGTQYTFTVIAVDTVLNTSTESSLSLTPTSTNSGTIDTSFDTDGKQTVSLDHINSIAVQSDGKIVAAGDYYISSTCLAVARLNTNGSLDTSFSTDGYVYQLTGTSSIGRAVAIQSDGKIVVAGECDNSGRMFLVMRLNPDGSLDTSFSGDGIVTTSIGTSCAAYSVAIQDDGKIIAAGTSEDKNFAFARYDTNGSLDTSFDGDGILIQHIGDTGTNEQINALAIQPDGKIIAAGYATVTSEVWAIARFNSNGTLDTGFGSGGKNIEWTHSNPADESAHGPSPGNKKGIQSIALQSDGKIAAAGYYYGWDPISGGTGDWTLDFRTIRFTSGGATDTSFGTSGYVVTPIMTGSNAGDDIPYGLVIQADGKILVGGSGYYGSFNNQTIVRYGADGAIDGSFGVNGKKQGEVVGNVTCKIAVQNDGKIIIGGGNIIARYYP